ncbi:DUF58 domain-containing protein [Cellulomonas palmilytica]|uniref:DUF58 domain-containing protein n=1 Tax=Cellulomonas palmilytica TaxID=2608402 RepID=UPI001F360863|nr:DUF58 domain-containing protein [Cellulomonas palmilytica]UJP38763.1 DUF58 domain-containing protein [Cellulomonas palmilytica]
MRLQPTLRGWALGATGLVLLLLGIGAGSRDLVRIGAVALVVVGAAAGLVAWLDAGGARRPLAVQRRVLPNPVHAGERVGVEVHITSSDPSGRARLAGLKFAEQAATELSAGRPLRARVHRSPGSVVVSYGVQTARRGRWPLGPLVVTRTDLFGTVASTTTLGEQAEVTVWPAVVPLPAPSDVLVGEPDRVALGARSPSTDDASLRDYREGDDLRRVHWRSSARRGELLVRSDERAGMRPVSVLLDLPYRGQHLEWTISLAASIALAMLDAGHPVRLLDGVGAHSTLTGVPFLHTRHDGARAALLDRTVDLDAPRTANDAQSRLVAGAHLLESTEAGGEIVLGVLGPLGAGARTALAHVADTAQGWAVVRSDPQQTGGQRDARATVDALHRAGWRACEATPGEPLLDCWLRLLGSAR